MYLYDLFSILLVFYSTPTFVLSLKVHGLYLFWSFVLTPRLPVLSVPKSESTSGFSDRRPHCVSLSVLYSLIRALFPPELYSEDF